jgi:hypothetical protein
VTSTSFSSRFCRTRGDGADGASGPAVFLSSELHGRRSAMAVSASTTHLPSTPVLWRTVVSARDKILACSRTLRILSEPGIFEPSRPSEQVSARRSQPAANLWGRARLSAIAVMTGQRHTQGYMSIQHRGGWCARPRQRRVGVTASSNRQRESWEGGGGVCRPPSQFRGERRSTKAPARAFARRHAADRGCDI